jgi:hypothetical protein
MGTVPMGTVLGWYGFLDSPRGAPENACSERI